MALRNKGINVIPHLNVCVRNRHYTVVKNCIQVLFFFSFSFSFLSTKFQLPFLKNGLERQGIETSSIYLNLVKLYDNIITNFLLIRENLKAPLLGSEIEVHHKDLLQSEVVLDVLARSSAIIHNNTPFLFLILLFFSVVRHGLSLAKEKHKFMAVIFPFLFFISVEIINISQNGHMTYKKRNWL